mmetsp:Transcript_80413/g.160521  ORF Transcript_80413/g.160521 Transcript_80413/m.160521 type:complete len:329 (+) Transcript_80413:87-1073(+)
MPADSFSPWESATALGQGTFGEVRRATRKKDGLPVALKRIFRGDRYEQEGLSHSAVREIRAMRELRHENLVELLDIFIEGGRITLVIELLSSTDLEGVVRGAAEGRLQLRAADVKAYTLMLLQGLAFLHEHMILHRDLKPSNCFISSSGVLKIGDFGFARCASCLDGSLQSPNACTQWYRAPEMLLGACQYGTAVDAWSAGCIFAELWHLKPLFRGDLEGGAGPNGEVHPEGHCEIDQLGKIFMHCGTPTENTWPGISELARFVEFQPCTAAPKILPPEADARTPGASELLWALLTLDPNRRASAQDCLAHPYFSNTPPPTAPASLPK